MGTSLTTRFSVVEQDSLSVLLPRLSRHLESASPDTVVQEIRHALKRLATDVDLNDATLTVFEVDGSVPRGAKIVTTGTGDEHLLVDLATEPWIIEKAIASESVVLTSEHHEPSFVSPDRVHRLWNSGVRALVAVTWRTRHDTVAAAVLCFLGARNELVTFSRDRTSVLDFVKRIGALLLGPAARTEDAVERRTWSRQPLAAGTQGAHAPGMLEDGILGHSDAWRYVMFRVDQVAATQATVLLLGETGTGKELVARAIHRRSTRRQNRFVALNCSALPPTLIESELFGRERGAFTGAIASQAGRFELANHGTLFLDEVGDLPLELQPKLLRVLQEGQIDRLGSTHTTNIDVRVIAATNRDLAADVANDRFRRDLYYRLHVFPITLPSLRDRVEDIPMLAAHFAERFARQLHKPVEPLSKAVVRRLQDHAWPGNIRELENVIQRAMIVSEAGVVSPDDICLSSQTDPAGPAGIASSDGETTLEAVERNHILRVLASTSWRIEGPGGAARALGLKPSTLRSRLQKLAIRRAGCAPSSA